MDAKIQGLIHDLREWDTTKATQAAMQLSRIGVPAIPALVKTLESGERPQCEMAAFTLSKIGAPAVDAIIPVLSAERVTARVEAAWTLAEIGPAAAAAIPALINALSDEKWKTRKAAAEALGHLGNAQHELEALARIDAGSFTLLVAALGSALTDPHEQVRCSAALALGLVGPRARSTVPALMERLADEAESDNCKRFVKAALAEIKKKR